MNFSLFADQISVHLISRKADKCFALFVFILVLGVSMFVALPAFAQDNCENLSENAEWIAGFKSIIVDVEQDNLDAALQTAQRLSSDICNTSPVLIYTIGKIYETKNDVGQAKIQFQKASELTFKYAIEPEMAQKIWNARYEIEHPERTELAVNHLNEEIKQLKAENEKLQSSNSVSHEEIKQLKAENEKLQSSKSVSSDKVTNQLKAENEKLLETIQADHFEIKKANSELRLLYKHLMWTGVGADIAGIVFLITGAILVGVNDDNPLTFDDVDRNHPFESNYKIRSEYRGGCGLIGTGITLIVAGTVMAGYFGFQYTHSQITDDVSLSIGSTGASLSMKF